MLRRNFFNDFEFRHTSGSFEEDLRNANSSIIEVIIPNAIVQK